MKNKNLAQLAELMSNIDKNDIAYDANGRMIIRTNYVGKFRTDTARHNNFLASQGKNKELLSNKLISPEDRVVRKSLTPWARELASSLREVMSRPTKKNTAHKIAEIYNNAALILFSINDVKAARELCYSQIQLFIDWSRSVNSNELLKYVFQPWINLSRLDRQEGYFYDAINKLNVLNTLHEPEVMLGHNKLMTLSLRSALQHDSDIHLVVRTCSIIEPIKAYLQSKRYEELIKFVQIKEKGAAKCHHAVLQESQIIAYANTGRVREALNLLTQARLYSDPALMHIFNLRECEIRAVAGMANDDLLQLEKLALRLLENKYTNINDVIYGLQVAYVLNSAGKVEEAIKLIYFCLAAAEGINDELLTTDCLIMLYEYIQDKEGRQLIESLMIEHYFHTQYVHARLKLLRKFTDLKNVESKHNHESILSLVDE